MAANPAVIEAAEDAGLRYVTDASPGIRRIRTDAGFAYQGPDGKRVSDSKVLDRICSLAIPPAYERVWICADPNGHLQFTGVDARGRKQYRYHSKFREHQDETKFHRMQEFGRALPRIRQRLDVDLAKRTLSREKVLAAVVYLLDRSLIRIGSEEYVKENKSYGLTTMLTRQVRISGQKIEFTFMGKSKIKHRIEINDAKLAKIIKRIGDLPGQELLHFIDEKGGVHSVSSTDVNAYIREISGKHFTAKDFRTWWGTLLAYTELSVQEAPSSKAGANRAISAAMKNVAEHLGNTPAVCRKCYVHPSVVKSFLDHTLKPPKDTCTQIKIEHGLLRFLACLQSA